MVFLHQQNPSRKMPSASFVPLLRPSKTLKSSDDGVDAVEKMVSILAEGGCTLVNPSGPLCPDHHKLRRHLSSHFASSSDDRSHFLSGFSFYIQSPQNLLRVIASSNGGSPVSIRNDSLVRHLLLVPSIQLDVQNMLLEKLPEYFDVPASLPLEEDVARLIINQFRWLDFIEDPNAFMDKLMQVLSICPLDLKKEIIGSLPEIIGDQNNKTVVDSLEQMLQEDSSVIVPVLDSFSNLNLDVQLQEQVITIGLSCIRAIDAEHMPYLLRFLLLSAAQTNIRRIISRIREQLKFVGMSNSHGTERGKLKGKLVVDNKEASILDALRSSLRFKNILCQEILKELNCLENPRDHKVIDIWLLMLIHTNCNSMRKSIEKIFKKKIIEGCIQEALLDQCICGKRELVQEYFPFFLSLSEYLLACKEQKAREFGIHIYSRLFEEFVDTYSRQEVLGAIITHVGSGVCSEVSSALQLMVFLASKHAEELIPLSSHINGLLEYLEGFTMENLHMVYEVFCNMALSASSSSGSFRLSIANELLMILRKQVNHPDLKYKKMGLIGVLKIVSCLADGVNKSWSSPFQKSNSEEALELLKISLESCKQFVLSLIFFYDELTTLLECRVLQPAIMEWIGKHVGDFESLFLSDLEAGQLLNKNTYGGLEGELWMNLDGEISPICLNILPLASSSSQSDSLQFLPAYFSLLSTFERVTNQGSLGGIDALLGCALHLPSPKYFTATGWKSLSGKQKQIICLSLYYAVNWIRELLNAFCTQVAGKFNCTSQATKEDIISKLLKRLTNLVFLESLLNHSIRMYPVSLPQLHLHIEHSVSSLLSQPNHIGHLEESEIRMTYVNTSSNKRKHGKISKTSVQADAEGKNRQPTLFDVLRKAGKLVNQEVQNEVISRLSSIEKISESGDERSSISNDPEPVEISAVSQALEAQRFRFRPLLVHCFYILTFSKNHNSSCSDPAAELPMYLYLLHDLHYKLDYFTYLGKQLSSRSINSVGFTRMTVDEFLSNIRSLFPSLKSLLNSALGILKEGDETCQEHWKFQSAAAGNPDISNHVISKPSVSTMVFKEVLNGFSKMLNLHDVQRNESVLSDLLEAFQSIKTRDDVASYGQSFSCGEIESLYIGACSFVESVLDTACSLSFTLASESLFTLESAVTSVQKVFNKSEANSKSMQSKFSQILPALRQRVETSAHKLLKHNWNDENLENGWKNKGEIVQKILRIYLEYSESTSGLVVELACSIFPQVSSQQNLGEDDLHGFTTLCSATFLPWYRVLFEVNLTILNKLVKEVHSEKSLPGVQPENVETHLIGMQKTVNVTVALVNMSRTCNRVTVHALAVKYGGKFIDSFLKAFDFLEVHFQAHDEAIILLVKELQKATRTIQTLCSEAKGSKQMAITSKIPATKRSLERFLFRVKALLHATSSHCTFWMGNLKHKDLAGQVVSSQVYIDDQNDIVDEDPEAAINDDETAAVASSDRETE
ncbi:hypothetical protein SLE2022_117980 [Rubroshorea leprosula]